MSQLPKILMVKDPKNLLDAGMKKLSQTKKKEPDIIDFDFLEELEKIEIKKSFYKYMDKEAFKKNAAPDRYDLSSEAMKKKFKKILDGYAEISYEVRNDEGELENEGLVSKRIKIHLFNSDDDHFMGLHLAILCLEGISRSGFVVVFTMLFIIEEGEESWFSFNDAYMAPIMFAQDLVNMNTDIEMHTQMMVYKIKLYSIKVQQAKMEARIESEDGQGVFVIDKDQQEMEAQTFLQKSEERKDVIKHMFLDGKYSESYTNYKKLKININNQINKFTKILGKDNKYITQMQQLEIQVGQNACAAASKKEDWSNLHETAKQMIAIDPNNQKCLYFEAKARFKLAYFEEAQTCMEAYLKRFPDDKDSATMFGKYLQFIEQKKSRAAQKEKNTYKAVFDSLEEEEQKEKIRKMNRDQIDQQFKNEKDQLVKKVLAHEGYEFSNQDFDLIQKLNEDDDDENIYQSDSHTHDSECSH